MERLESGRSRMLGNRRSILQNSVTFAEEISNSQSQSIKSSDFKTCEYGSGEFSSDFHSNSISLSVRSSSPHSDSRIDSQSDSQNSKSFESSYCNCQVGIDEIQHPTWFETYPSNSKDQTHFIQRYSSNFIENFLFNGVDEGIPKDIDRQRNSEDHTNRQRFSEGYLNQKHLSHDYVNYQHRFSQSYATPIRFSNGKAETHQFSQDDYANNTEQEIFSQILANSQKSRDENPQPISPNYSDPENFFHWPSHTRTTSYSTKPPSGSPVVPSQSPQFFDALRSSARNSSPSEFVVGEYIDAQRNERQSEDDALRGEHIDNWIGYIDAISRASTSSF
ncbi:hypothetical protein HK096_002648, partial [Nowakowskiella sp. JEL0078]